MSRSIYNTWSEFRAGLDQILLQARHTLDIFDTDLRALELDQAARAAQLARLVGENPGARIRIALQHTDHLHREQARLIRLLESHGHQVQVQQTPVQLERLRDTLVLADGVHGLVRFDREHPRSKLLLDDTEACKPYQQRFEEIWQEGGQLFSPTTLGL